MSQQRHSTSFRASLEACAAACPVPEVYCYPFMSSRSEHLQTAKPYFHLTASIHPTGPIPKDVSQPSSFFNDSHDLQCKLYAPL